MPRFVLLFGALMGFAACASPDISEPTVVSLGAGAIDVRFYPLPLEPGDRVEFTAGRVRLSSALMNDGRHHVLLSAPNREVVRVTGLSRGVPQYSRFLGDAEEADETPDGGSTTDGPTSVHRETHCTPTSCTEIIEYDYDAVPGDGSGDASKAGGHTDWVPGGESAAVRIDRLRYELRGRAAGDARLIAPSDPKLLR
ncbi:hypothetical protein [Rubricoccus marinus]|uniref:Uncharacterized protein n=1 Tax=Rubricoccus marinus TaxID=716817 RepID=A0A259TUS3_9BACT|nr:hypothetical protein [Rubricoccus marinus]OZC01450.1 hypothetical protein BSZ36_17385 [Rubricoccus marinus]